MNHRLTLTTAAAVILASVSLYPLILGIGWFWAGAGAVLVTAAAGTATRLPALPAGVIATLLALGAAVPLLVSPAWYWELLGMVVIVCAAASVTRLRLLPAVASLITYLASLLLYLNLVFAGDSAAGHIVPTKVSLRHLWTLAGQGIAEKIHAPPVTGTHGVVLLAAAGIGLMAVAADLIAVRLRSPAIAGLPLLALFSVPITTNARQGAAGATVTFCLGITGYLALLSADGRERLRIWGRLVTLWQSGSDDDEPVRGPDTRALAASGRRIGLAAITLAIFIPLLLPGLRVHKLFSGHGGGGGGGPAISLPDPIVQMQGMLQHGSNATILTYRTGNPDPQDQYLQVQVLNYNPGTSTWNPQLPTEGIQVSGGQQLPTAPGLSALIQPRHATTQISMSSGVRGYSSAYTFLPLPYVPDAVKVSGSWQADLTTLMVYSSRVGLAGLRYTVTSDDVEPSVQQLDEAGAPPSSITRPYLPFPSPDRARLLALAKQVTNGARTAYQKAYALETWFRASGLFTYSLQSKEPDTPAGLLNFLTTSRRGYCQQFAFAMAALARLVGIPSRIAVGYTAGTRQPDGAWTVTEADAHAWPELYFSGAGWLRFEPTPGGKNGQGTATEPVYALSTAPGGPGTGHTKTTPGGAAGTAPGSAGAGGNLPRRLRPAGGLGGTATSGHTTSPPLGPIAIAILALAVAPRIARSATRRRRWQAARSDSALAHAAWRELRDDLTDYGAGWRVSESPRAVSRRLATTLRLDTGSQDALDRIVRAEERARYAKVAQAPATLRADVTTIRRVISADASRPARWRARLLPPSALAPARAGLQQALDVFGWLDAAGLRVRGRVRRLGRESTAD
jgi:transglutaminase-like putative cysteine protease